MLKSSERLPVDTMATAFVDSTMILRMFGDEKAAEVGVTREKVQAMLVDISTETFIRGPYSKWITFRDGSCAAQVVGSKRWEMFR